ncbi:MAG: DeoR/GlpR family DNA-binding transcription regulator [Planctomycetota bacterium]
MTAGTRQRRQTILTEAYQRGHVTVRDLAERCDCSEATVRRDLRALAEAGQLKLTHGGAYLPRSASYAFRSKAMRNVDAKRAIGRKAAELARDGDQVFLDSGTTCLQLARFCRAREGLSVIVNSVRAAEELDAPGLDVILIGGQYRPDRMDAVGPIATAALDNLRGYVAFIGTDGLGMDFGPSASDIESAEVYGLAVRNAREAVLLADASKFACPSLYRICPWDAIGRVVTDRPPQPEWSDFFTEREIEVILPTPTEAAEPVST